MYHCMKLRHIEEQLQQLDIFEKPKIQLEQYPTPPHIASHMLHVMQSTYGDIEGKMIGDLGCGSGMLTIGTAMLDAALTVGFDIDMDALEILLGNIEDLELTNVDVIHADVRQMSERWNKVFDTILMNPPFGTKHNAGIDMLFLKSAFRMATSTVYSLHKTSTRNHVLKVAKDCGVKAEVIAKLHYNLPNTYRFHKKNNVDIDVDFYRFELIS